MAKPKVASESKDQFDHLQKKLVPLWKSIERFNQDPQTIVVVPSISIDAISEGAVMQAYEERFLFLLLLLRQPRARLIYVTSQAILPSIIDYYLDLLPGVIPSHAHQRLFLLSPLDGSVSPLSQENLVSADDVIEAITEMRARKPSIKQVLIKLNEGVSGEGNALVDLSGLSPSEDSDARTALQDRLRAMRFELKGITYDSYMKKLEERKGVVEERIAGEEFRSPSVQLRITPLGSVELLSTHDQLLGGPSGQSYLGCAFPADSGYASLITRQAAKVGRRLAKEGVIGRFALDFVVVRSNEKWDPYAIEINLRKGGTTHPFLTLQFLTDGTYDPETAIFTAPNGQHKFFVASDHVESPLYRTLTPDDLFDIVVRHNLHFDQTRQTGVVFHMMSALGELGRTGLTAVGNSHEEASDLYKRAVEVLNEETRGGGT